MNEDADLEAILGEIFDFDLTPAEEDFVNGLLATLDEGGSFTYAQINDLEELYEEAQSR